MALTVAELAFVFGADTKAVDKALAGVDRKVDGTARAATQRMGGFWSRQEQDSTRFGNAVGKAAAHAKKALIGLTAGAGVALGAMFISGIKGAGDLEETVSKAGVVFGEAAAEVRAFAQDSSRNILLTEQAALDAAATFGTYGKSAGLAGQDLAGFSTELTALASDLASFNNTSPEQAIEALGSALRGESEPIRAYSVMLDDATLRQEALKQGLIETTKEALTPQQKILASHALILKQTSDAQGDAARTADSFTNRSRDLVKQITELRTEMGQKALPAATEFVGFLGDKGVPAVRDMGGALSDAARFFGGLPAPVKAATAALVAFRVASSLGVTGGVASGFRAAGSGLDSLRLRAMFTADAFRDARGGAVHLRDGLVTGLTPAAGRATAAMAGLRAGAMGAGGALRRGLGGAVAMFGGPWGIAIAAATAGVAFFWSEHQKAKQHVEALTASLDQQTGAMTESSRADIFNSLQKAGAFDAARKLGLGLATVQAAAEGEADAIAFVNRALDEQIEKLQGAHAIHQGFSEGTDETSRAAINLAEVLGDESHMLAESRRELRNKREALGDATDATDDNADAVKGAAKEYRTYRDRIKEAREALQDLVETENQRREDAVQSKRDQLGLLSQIRETRQELREGKRTLDENTVAGQENMAALLDLADQWNNSTDEVKNSKGAYRDMRQTFIDLGMTVSDNKKLVRDLADEFVTLPTNKRIPVSVPGAEEALRKLQAIRAEMVYVSMGGSFATPTEGRNRPSNTPGSAGGGYTGDGPKYQIAGPVHRGEFVLDAVRTRQYRPLLDAMHAGGPVRMGDFAGMGAAPATAAAPAGLSARDFDRLAELVVSSVLNARPLYGDVHMRPHSYSEFARQMEQDRRQAAGDGIRRR